MKIIRDTINYGVRIFVFVFAVIACIGQVLDDIRLDNHERLYFIPPNFVIFGGMALSSIIILWLNWRIVQRLVLPKIPQYVVFLFFAGITIVWVVVARVLPESDASYCLKIAAEFYDGIFYSLKSGQYLDVYRINAAYCLYLLILTAIGGVNNVIFVQVVNALLLAYTISAVYKLLMNKSDWIAYLFILFVIIYCPMWMQVTFCYGNVLGMCTGILACINMLKYMDEGRLSTVVLSTILLAFSCIFKGISYIYLIALIVSLLFEYINGDKKRNAVIAICSVLLSALIIMLISNAVAFGLKKVSDGVLSDNGGSPTLAWVVMGLDLISEDGDRSTFGWYSAYNANTYLESGCDKSASELRVRRDLAQTINKALSSPSEFTSLLLKKIQTVWNEPTFGVFYRNNIEFSNGHDESAIYDLLINETGSAHKWIIRCLRVIQFLIYFGVILYVVLDRSNYFSIWGIVAFTGAFVFFLAWEAKSEYVLSYFAIVSVYAFRGYENFFGLLAKNVNNVEKQLLTRILNFRVFVVLLTFAVISVGYLSMYIRYDDTDAYQNYLDDHTYVRQGNYNLKSLSNQTVMFSNIYADYDLSSFETTFYDNAERKYNIYLNWDPIDQTNYPLIASLDGLNVDIVPKDKVDNEDKSIWRIVRRGKGYIVKCWYDQNKVWTYDDKEDRVILTDYIEDNENQIWIIK